MVVEALWLRTDGVSVNFTARFQLISRNVGVLRLTEKIPAGQQITLRRRIYDDVWKSTQGRVRVEIDTDSEGFLYAFRFLEPSSAFCNIESSAPERTEHALGRLLMECSVCHLPEVVTQLTQMEQVEIELGQQFLPARTDPRIKSRLVACIRHGGRDEEAVCENLSQGGVSFRSRTQYAEGSRVEIAVPFRPGINAIFVPARIIFSLPVRGAGLFRHGVAYVKNLL
jgi:PilZ domain-containing protein